MVKLKVCVCSDMTLDVFFNSTSPAQIPALAAVISVLPNVTDTIPLDGFVY